MQAISLNFALAHTENTIFTTCNLRKIRITTKVLSIFFASAKDLQMTLTFNIVL